MTVDGLLAVFMTDRATLLRFLIARGASPADLRLEPRARMNVTRWVHFKSHDNPPDCRSMENSHQH
jgi:hypothetical protein